MKDWPKIILVIYLFYIGSFLNNPMSNSIVDLTIAMVDDHSFEITPYSDNRVYVSIKDGKFYSGMPPGLSLMSTPIYLGVKILTVAIPDNTYQKINEKLKASLDHHQSEIDLNQKRFEVLLTCFLIILAFNIPLAWFCYVLLEKEINHLGVPQFTLPMFFLMTPLAFYIPQNFHTTISVLLLFISFLLIQSKLKTKYKPLLVGLFLGLVPTLDYPAITYSMVLMSLFVTSHRKDFRSLIQMILAFSVPVILMLIYHKITFGQFLTTSYNWHAPRGGFIQITEEVSRIGIKTFMFSFEKMRERMIDPMSGLLFNNVLVIAVLIRAVFSLKRMRLLHFDIWACLIIILGNIYYYFSLPQSTGTTIGAFGARYCLYAVPFAFWLWLKLDSMSRPMNKTLITLSAFTMIYYFPFWSYGSQVKNLEIAFSLFRDLGPSNYLITKASQAGLMPLPYAGWIFSSGLAVLLIIFSRKKV